MAELIIWLWLSIVLCSIAGMIIGFFFGKVLTMRKMNLCYTEEQVQGLIKENEELITENQKYIVKYLDLEILYKNVSRETPEHIELEQTDYYTTYDAQKRLYIISINESSVNPHAYDIETLWLILKKGE